MLDDIGRQRALSGSETDLLETLVDAERDGLTFSWSPQVDQILARAAARRRMASVARLMGINPNAAYQRLYRVRQRDAR